jgi:hypothetical protein
MAQTKSIGRIFVVYGRDPVRYRKIERGNLTIIVPLVTMGTEYVVESTDWQWDENHRGGRGCVVHLGPVCFGVGAFDRGLSAELLGEIEEGAVWLEVDPGDIGRWRGGLEAGAEGLGYGYEVERPAGETAAVNEYDGAEALD